MNPQEILDEIRKDKSVSIRYDEDAWNGDSIPAYVRAAADAAKYFGKNHPEVEIIAINQGEWGGIKFVPRSKERELKKELETLRGQLYRDNRPQWRSFQKLTQWGVLKGLPVEQVQKLVEIHERWNNISYELYEMLHEKHYRIATDIPHTPDYSISQYEYDVIALRKKYVEEFGDKVSEFFKDYFVAAMDGNAPVIFPFDKRSIEEISDKQVKEVLSYKYKTFIR